MTDSAAAYRNPGLPVDARVRDLVGRMSVEEKAGQLRQILSKGLWEKRSGKPELTQEFERAIAGHIGALYGVLRSDPWTKRTLETGKATYWSRSRQSFWVKGESSGNVQLVKEVLVDCDEDTVVLKVEQVGDAACHEGYRSCFFRRVEDGELKVVGQRVFDPKTVYKK